MLLRNRPALARQGCAVWTPAQARGGVLAGLLHAAGPPRDATVRRAERAVGLMGIECDRLARAGMRRLLLSEQEILGNVGENLRLGTLYDGLAARLARFGSSMAPRCHRVGIAIRGYDTYWASGLAAGLATGQPVPSAAALAALCAQARRWRNVITELAQAFPQADIIVWPFERFASQPDVPLAHLLGIADVGADFTGRSAVLNAGPGRMKLRQLLSLRGENAVADALPPGEGRWMPFDPSQQATLRRAYAEDIAWLRGGADGLARFVEAALCRVDAPRMPADIPASAPADTTRTVAARETLSHTRGAEDWSAPARFEITSPNGPDTTPVRPAEARQHGRTGIVG